MSILRMDGGPPLVVFEVVDFESDVNFSKLKMADLIFENLHSLG